MKGGLTVEFFCVALHCIALQLYCVASYCIALYAFLARILSIKLTVNKGLVNEEKIMHDPYTSQ